MWPSELSCVCTPAVALGACAGLSPNTWRRSKKGGNISSADTKLLNAFSDMSSGSTDVYCGIYLPHLHQLHTQSTQVVAYISRVPRPVCPPWGESAEVLSECDNTNPKVDFHTGRTIEHDCYATVNKTIHKVDRSNEHVRGLPGSKNLTQVLSLLVKRRSLLWQSLLSSCSRSNKHSSYSGRLNKAPPIFSAVNSNHALWRAMRARPWSLDRRRSV